MQRVAPWYHSSVSSDSPTTGELWIVATPIGTLGDLSVRAKEILQSVDLVLAEDTRRARTLLTHFEISPRAPLVSLHEHNEEAQLERLLGELVAGKTLAMISDAGTPVLSDPGFKLVRAVRDAGIDVRSVPGPSAFTAALAASGQPPLPATLCGFLPSRSGPRRRRLEELAVCPWTLVVLLSPHRVGRELTDLAAVLGDDRRATVLAEISKRYERAATGTLAELAEDPEFDTPRGEYVAVVGPAAPADGSVPILETVRSEYERALDEGLDRADAMRRAARRFGLRRRDVFDMLKRDDSVARITDED
jgi:16S rRNA (cytidine1402-2'-O)-methyltransferase